MRALLIVVVTGMSLAGIARADVVGPEPESCPAGTIGRSCHGGPYCAPRGCAMDAECGEGAACVERTLCITRIGCAGGLPPDADPADFEVDQVEGSCPDDCGGECRAERVCVSTSSVGGGSDGGCCTTAPGRPARHTALAVVGLVAAAGALAATRLRRNRRG